MEQREYYEREFLSKATKNLIKFELFQKKLTFKLYKVNRKQSKGNNGGLIIKNFKLSKKNSKSKSNSKEKKKVARKLDVYR